MREFNTSGPCNPKLHYTVMREELLKVGLNMVEKGKYFTIWAPRQAGKTTYFKLLIEEINRGAGYLALWISFERYKNISSSERFFQGVKISIFDEIEKRELKKFIEEANLKDEEDLFYLFRDIYHNFNQKLILVIDEIEGCPDAVISGLMHTFREMYHKKHLHALHSLILVGVSNISGIIMDYASPFNIADELRIPYFTKSEVADLINQYEVESTQRFAAKVKQKIFQDTAGQPGLVCGICKDLVEKFCPDKIKPINLNDYWECLDYYLREKIDKNISNKEYVIETKRYTDNSYYQKGKRQLMEYLKSERLSEGYYVVFSNVHQDEDILKEKEEIEGKIIHSYIIRTNIKSPTR